jgi:enoyl-CoA hydratase/carnithine racemase
MLLSARTIDALEALRVGLVNSVVSLDRVEEHTYELARDMAALAPLSHSRHKQIRQAVLRNPRLDRLTPDEEHLPFANFDSEDFQEGRRAFLEHQAPRFKGR